MVLSALGNLHPLQPLAHLKFVFSGEAISLALLENGRHSQIAILNHPSAAPLEAALTLLDANATSLGH